MFRTDSKVEKGRVSAHETAESGVAKVHTLIDKVAEGAEAGQDKAAEAAAVASAKAAELRSQADDARKSARKDSKKALKSARKDVKKGRKQAASEVHDLKDTLVDDVLPKVLATAAGLAATGSEAGRKLADEAQTRAPEAFAALKDDRDAHGALAALKGEKPKKRRGLKLLVLAAIAGGIAAYVAKKQQGPKKDPWAVPAGDPYKAPETGRASTVADTPIAAATAAAATETGPAESAFAGDTTHAAMTGHPDGLQDGETRPLTNDEVDQLASDNPDEAHVGEPESTAVTEGAGTDAWSSANDWADESSIPGEGDQRA